MCAEVFLGVGDFNADDPGQALPGIFPAKTGFQVLKLPAVCPVIINGPR